MYTRQVEVLFSNQFGESNNCPIFHPQYQNVLFWLAFTREWKGVCVCVCVLRGRDGRAEFSLLFSRK